MNRSSVMRLIISLGFLLLMGHSPLRGQDSLTLEAAIGRTLERNYGIQSAGLAVESAKVANQPGNAGMLPTVNLTARQTVSSSNTFQSFRSPGVDNINARGVGSDNLDISFNAEQILFDGGGMFKVKARLAEREVLVTLSERVEVEGAVMLTITAYLDAVVWQQELALLSDQLALSTDRFERIRLRYERGAARRIELLDAQVDLEADSAALLQARTSYRQALQGLNFLMADSISTEYVLATTQPAFEPLDSVQMADRMHRHNILLRQSASQKQVARLDYEVFRAAAWPEIFVQGSYGFSTSANDASFIQRSQTGTWTIGVGLRWDLFSGFREHISRRQADLAHQQQELGYQELMLSLERDFAQAYTAYRERGERYAFAEHRLGTAQENLDLSKDLYAVGALSSLELREAQLRYAQARRDFQRLQVDLQRSEALLHRLAGDLLSE